MKIYIASFFDTKDRILPYVAKIRDMGYPQNPRYYELTSTWLNETHTGELSEGMKNWYGYRDLRELDYSDLLIIDTFDETPRGGREVEMGYCMGRGIHVWVVGPMRNVFHRLADIKFASWDEVLKVLEERTYALHNQ